MRFRDAKKIHSEDEVRVRLANNRTAVRRVVEVEIDDVERSVYVRCDDGAVYRHSEIA